MVSTLVQDDAGFHSGSRRRHLRADAVSEKDNVQDAGYDIVIVSSADWMTRDLVFTFVFSDVLSRRGVQISKNIAIWVILKTYVSLALHSERYETRLK